MSAALNPKRFFSGPDRPMSADPTSMRPSFSSFSSFSSIFSGGRHSRSNSSAQNSGAPPLARPASAAPTQQAQTKWVPRPTTPGMPTTMSQSRSSRHRSTSSASAAAAALSSSADHPLPPIPAQPQDSQQHRSSPTPSPGEGAVDSDALEVWKAEMKLRVEARYMRRLTEERKAFGQRVRSARRHAVNGASHRRDSLSSGSATSSSTDEESISDEVYSRLKEAYEKVCERLKFEFEEEMRAVYREEARRRGTAPPPHTSSRPPKHWESEQDGVLVEDELADEWTWRPEENGNAHQPSEGGDRDRVKDREKWKEMVRQEQQVIWEAIKRGPTPGPQQPLSSSAGRKVHFAPATPPSSDPSTNVNPPSATQTQAPTLPRTPHTPVGMGYPGRPISAHPSVSNANRPLSPAVTAPGVRPSSARPASPAYTRWIPSTGPSTTSATAASTGQGQSGRTGSNPINIPGRNNSGNSTTESNGSAGKDRPGSVSGSWRDWSTPAHGHLRRDAPTPSPTTAANGHAYPYPRTASNSNLHSSMYPTVQMHSRTPSSGNLHAAAGYASHHGHARVPSNGNLHSATASGMRRALTPGPVSSASGYARQRTASMNAGSGVAPPTQRAPSVPPLPTSVSRERERDREKDRERRKKGVVDDREPDDASAAAGHTLPVKRVQATAGLGSRTSSNRSALVDDDAPVPEAFSAPAMRGSSSRHSNHSHHKQPNEEEEEEDIPPPPRRDKGKGKARAPPSPLLSTTPLPGVGRRGREGAAGFGGMYAAQLEDFASSLRRDLGISAEA